MHGQKYFVPLRTVLYSLEISGMERHPTDVPWCCCLVFAWFFVALVSPRRYCKLTHAIIQWILWRDWVFPCSFLSFSPFSLASLRFNTSARLRRSIFKYFAYRIFSGHEVFLSWTSDSTFLARPEKAIRTAHGRIPFRHGSSSRDVLRWFMTQADDDSVTMSPRSRAHRNNGLNPQSSITGTIIIKRFH